MSRAILIYFIRFILLVLIQVLILNEIQFGGLVNPFLYIYFILLLPVDFSPNGGLLLGFLLGLIVDMFDHTLGMHTIATVFLAYARPYVLQYMSPRDGYEFSRTLGIKQMGWLWFLTYALIMVFLHHFVLFFIESFRMSGFWFTIGKAIGSSALTLSLIVVVQLLFTGSNKSGFGYD